MGRKLAYMASFRPINLGVMWEVRGRVDFAGALTNPAQGWEAGGDPRATCRCEGREGVTPASLRRAAQLLGSQGSDQLAVPLTRSFAAAGPQVPGS